jgi:hypothetical protein
MISVAGNRISVETTSCQVGHEVKGHVFHYITSITWIQIEWMVTIRRPIGDRPRMKVSFLLDSLLDRYVFHFCPVDVDDS